MSLTLVWQVTYNQIFVDLPRTNPAMPLFQDPNVQQALHRILYVWAIRHPGTGYVQGINDIVTPFFFVFLMEVSGLGEDEVASGRVMMSLPTEHLQQVEADSYHCLTMMLDKAQDNYVHDSKGIQVARPLSVVCLKQTSSASPSLRVSPSLNHSVCPTDAGCIRSGEGVPAQTHHRPIRRETGGTLGGQRR